MLTFKLSDMPSYKVKMKKNRKWLPLQLSGKKRAKLALQRHAAILHQAAKKNVEVWKAPQVFPACATAQNFKP